MTDTSDPSESLLRRLLDHDPVASAEFCERFLPLLLAQKRAWAGGRTQDEHLIDAAAADALLAFVRQPERYDATKLSVLSYLKMAAGRDLQNALARERRHAIRRLPLEAVELAGADGNGVEHAPELPGGVSSELLLRRLLEVLPDPRDRAAMSLRLDGVRETAAYAQIYELGHLVPQEQRRAVKRHKDRLEKKAKRLGLRLRDQ